MRCSPSREENLAKALAMTEDAARQGAQIVCLPELFLSPYFCQKPANQSAFAGVEPIPGPTTERLAEAARRLEVVLIGGSLFEQVDRRDAPKGRLYYNTCPIFGPDGTLLGIYRKTHLPEDPGYHEQHYFAPGDTGIRVFETPFGRIAPLICYDQWFPEAARIAALRGAEILIYPTAIGRFTDEKPAEGDWQKAWEDVQRGHAIANNVFVAAVNRVGTEDSIAFFGGSFVCSEFGEVLAHAGTEEEVLLATVDLARVEATREAWGFFRNRRPELYGDLTKKP